MLLLTQCFIGLTGFVLTEFYNNAFATTGSDGLDPRFACIQDLIVIGGDMVFFCVKLCDVLYFDDHFHAYVINISSQQTIVI